MNNRRPHATLRRELPLGRALPPGECPHRPPCPGCPSFGVPGVTREALEALTKLAQANGLPAPHVVEGAKFGFRHRARLAIRGRANSPKIGIFETGTHRVVHIPNCVVQHPLINQVASVVRSVLAAEHVPPYSDVPHAGVARYLQVAIERSSQTAQVVLVANTETHEPLVSALNAIATTLGPRLHSLFWNGNTARSNTILGDAWWQHSGSEMLRESFGGPSVYYPPGAFGQSNLDLAEHMVQHVSALVPNGAKVAEFYAGVGAIGLTLAPRVGRLLLNEIGAASLVGLERGISELPPEVRANLSVHPGTAESASAIVPDADTVIADPPRKGLDSGLLDALLSTPLDRFVYISCGLASFLRDAERLLGSKQFALRELTVYALIPFTEHVETVALFERSAAAE